MTEWQACLACGCLVHDDEGCEPSQGGDLIPLPCPACGRDAVYLSGIDRYAHQDSRYPNEPCWLKAVQGNTDKEIHRANDLILADRSRERAKRSRS